MLEWLQGTSDIDQLIARGHMARAIKLLLKQVAAAPENTRLALRLADALARDGREQQAVGVLLPVAEAFAREGFVAKAVAVLKKVERLDPGQVDAVERLIERFTERSETALPVLHPLPSDPLQAAAKGPEPETAAAQAEGLARGGGRRPRPIPAKTSELHLADLWFKSAQGRESLLLSPLLEGFSAPELAAILKGLRLLVKNPGAIIFTQGEPGASLFILASGTARLYRHEATGKNRQIGMVEEGTFFGAASLLSGAPRSATIVAAGVCELLELDGPAFERITASHPQVRERVSGYLTARREKDRGGR